MKKPAKKQRPPGPPSREDVVAFIGTHKGKAGVREIARAFGLKNNDRTALRHMLRDLEGDGTVEKRRKKLHHAGTLPSVVLSDITERDRDGELIAVPTEWDTEEHGEAPRIRVYVPRKARSNEIPGVGDRALLRTEEIAEEGPIRHTGRVIKILDRSRQRQLGVFRLLPNGGGRLEPMDKKQLGRELSIPPGATADAKDGDLVAVELTRHGRLGLPTAQVKERLGSLKSERAASFIAIHAHEIPHVFRREALAEAEAARPAGLVDREDWRQVPLVTIDPIDAKDHDDAVYAEADSDPGNPGGFVVTVAIADVAHYVMPASALDREALVRGNSVYFPDQVVPMLPERISNDLCSLRPNEDRAALAVRLVIGANGRKRTHSFHRVLMCSAAKLHYAQAQEAADGRTDETTGPLLDPVIRPLYSAYAAVRRERAERQPLDLDLPERKILLKPDGTIDRVVVPPRLDAHRLIEEFMILANVAAAETLGARANPVDLSRARRAGAGEARGSARISCHPRHHAGQGSGVAPGRLQQNPCARERHRARATGQRGRAAHAGAGGILRGELWPLRPEPAAICTLHLADPPLRRPRRASCADPRTEPRPRWDAQQHGRTGLERDRGAHFGRRAARHEGRARNRRPADRELPRRPHWRELRGPHQRRDPRRVCS